MSFYTSLLSSVEEGINARVSDAAADIDCDTLMGLLKDAFTPRAATVTISGDSGNVLTATYRYRDTFYRGMPYKVTFTLTPQSGSVHIQAVLLLGNAPAASAEGVMHRTGLRSFIEACKNFGTATAGVSGGGFDQGVKGIVDMFRKMVSYFSDSQHLKVSKRLPQSLKAIQYNPDAVYFLYNQDEVYVIPPVRSTGPVIIEGDNVDGGEAAVPPWALWR